jgi:Flp pilus assembly protein TadG
MAGVHSSACLECRIRTDTKNHRARISNAAREGEPVMKFFRDECAQATVMMAMSIFCLCGMAGFAVDVGTMFKAKRMLQTAADAGAIAAIAEYRYGGLTAARAAAKAATAQNGESDTFNGVTVAVNNPVTDGSHTGSGYVEVVVTQAAPTYFMKVFHLSSMNVSARAVAGFGPASGCIYALDTSGIDIGMTGTSDLSMPNCGIVVNSGSSNAINLTGGATITADSVGVVGNVSQTARTSISPTPVTGVAPAFDPLSYISAPDFNTSSCLGDPGITGNRTTTIGPSVAGGTVCYTGLSVSGSGTVTMTPGLYIINGSFSFTGSGEIDGTGVTFYFPAPGGSASLTGSGVLNISAPTSGTWNGILFYEDANNTNAMKISGSSSSTIEGIFYAPSANLTMTGSSNSHIYADLVVSSLSMTGTSNFSNYSSINPNEPLQSSYLME